MQKIYFENNHSLPICILGIAKHCMNNVLSCILRKYNYGGFYQFHFLFLA